MMNEDYIAQLENIGSRYSPPSDGYAAGDVLPNGEIRLDAWSLPFGWSIPRGQVWVTPQQWKAAEPFGWKAVNNSGVGLVIVER